MCWCCVLFIKDVWHWVWSDLLGLLHLISCDMVCLNSCHVSNHGMRCLHYIPLARFHTHSYKKNECDNIKFAVESHEAMNLWAYLGVPLKLWTCEPLDLVGVSSEPMNQWTYEPNGSSQSTCEPMNLLGGSQWTYEPMKLFVGPSEPVNLWDYLGVTVDPWTCEPMNIVGFPVNLWTCEPMNLLGGSHCTYEPVNLRT